MLGQGTDRTNALQLINEFKDINHVQAAWKAVGVFWDDLVGQAQVKASYKDLKLLHDRWLLYESLSCDMLSNLEKAEIYRKQTDALKFKFETNN